MKKLCFFLVVLLLTTAVCFALPSEYDSGLLPFDNAVLVSGRAEDSLWLFPEGCHYEVKHSGGYVGNHYLQIATDGKMPQLDMSKFITEPGSYTLEFAIRLNGIKNNKDYTLKSTVNGQQIEVRQTLRTNKWFIFSVNFFYKGEGDLLFSFTELPAECSAFCLDAVSLFSGVKKAEATPEPEKEEQPEAENAQSVPFAQLREATEQDRALYFRKSMWIAGIILFAGILLSAGLFCLLKVRKKKH